MISHTSVSLNCFDLVMVSNVTRLYITPSAVKRPASCKAPLLSSSQSSPVRRSILRGCPLTATSMSSTVLSRDDLPPAFADRIFALAPGESSEIIRADYGFHIFQVTERRPAELVPLAEAEPEIRERLARERSQGAVEKLAAEALERYDVEVYRRNLPFNYQGSYESPSA